MTTLELFCKAFGWQGGTIHQAKQRFAIASEAEMNHFCSLLMKELSNISDPRTALWFTSHRLEARGLKIRAMQAGH